MSPSCHVQLLEVREVISVNQPYGDLGTEPLAYKMIDKNLRQLQVTDFHLLPGQIEKKCENMCPLNGHCLHIFILLQEPCDKNNQLHYGYIGKGGF